MKQKGLFLLLGAILFSVSPSDTAAENLLQSVVWTELSAKTDVPGEILTPRPGVAHEQLKLEHRGSGGQTFALVVVDSPGITSSRYAVRGKVRLENVAKESYLEMWNVFPDGSRYFTRTLASSGPMSKLEGTSDWRPFALPFFIQGEGHERPERLEIRLVLKGRGTVFLSPLQLIEYLDSEDPLAIEGAWWGDRTAGIIGGIGGALVGCLGGLIGWMGSTGRGRGFALASLRLLSVLGLVSLVLGGVAYRVSQPYAVFYPLIMGGTLALMLGTFLHPSLRKRYEERELRRIRAIDASAP